MEIAIGIIIALLLYLLSKLWVMARGLEVMYRDLRGLLVEIQDKLDAK